jgi:hypothetical protein
VFKKKEWPDVIHVEAGELEPLCAMSADDICELWLRDVQQEHDELLGRERARTRFWRDWALVATTMLAALAVWFILVLWLG